MMKTPWAAVLIATGFMVLTIPSWVSLLSEPEYAPYSTFLIVLAVAYGITTIASAFLVNLRRAPALRITAVILVGSLGLILVVLLGAGSAPIFAPALCLMLVLLPRVPGIVTAMVSLLVLGVVSFVEGVAHENVPNFVMLLSVAIATMLVLQLVKVNEQLVDAKDAIADMAVLRERERVSRDLHDVLGRSATTIALKARLSAELLSRSDHRRALAEVEDINRLALTISRDTRDAVRNLRQTTLEAELLALEATAHAAGIRLDIHRTGIPEPHDEPVLALIIRESVTNAVRHANASLISITVEASGVEIADDGHGGSVIEGEGIRGMKDRLSACGGTLSVDSGQSQGTVVTARLP
ncbi:sensor histidine kinase [Auritidibacter sp. NML100628]|uniref:sensor histidine kinase n=1 Tax=Auritidibacter sp. NML100628 TaxID=2170742 RepID=UPI000D73FBF6|nr:histidine kinase [Auritidibacter sp. NML100628]PXA76891.1 hypothetical protein DCC24_06230 [Auritidibacter sp. NML100628]